MSTSLFGKIRLPRNIMKLLKGSPDGVGHRIMPSRTPKNDEDWEYRLDQGRYDTETKTYDIVIQKNGVPHGKVLASTTVNPAVDTPEEVAERLEVDCKARGYFRTRD